MSSETTADARPPQGHADVSSTRAFEYSATRLAHAPSTVDGGGYLPTIKSAQRTGHPLSLFPDKTSSTFPNPAPPPRPSLCISTQTATLPSFDATEASAGAEATR